jgi:hypothetical protein
LKEAILVNFFNDDQGFRLDLFNKKMSTFANMAFDLAMLSQGLLTCKNPIVFF